MTRLEQATKWWYNQKEGRIKVNDIPTRHKKILLKHKKIKINYNFGPIAAEDYYTLKD